MKRFGANLLLLAFAGLSYSQGMLPEVGVFTSGRTDLPLPKYTTKELLAMGRRLATTDTLNGSLSRQRDAARKGYKLVRISFPIDMLMWHGGDLKKKANYPQTVIKEGESIHTTEDPAGVKEIKWIEQDMFHVVTIEWWLYKGHAYCVNPSWFPVYGVTYRARSYKMTVFKHEDPEEVLRKVEPCSKGFFVCASEPERVFVPSFSTTNSVGNVHANGLSRTTSTTTFGFCLPRGKWSLGGGTDPFCIDIWNRPPLPL
jgi:hypothetical protein